MIGMFGPFFYGSRAWKFYGVLHNICAFFLALLSHSLSSLCDPQGTDTQQMQILYMKALDNTLRNDTELLRGHIFNKSHTCI